jgi:hypothetical protein
MRRVYLLDLDPECITHFPTRFRAGYLDIGGAADATFYMSVRLHDMY